ncbi:MAG: transcription antitermination factor NusB [Deltaproteobacteria bacterium]|nr:transcription antitermination factor NusB [Deltaproteobacteria bacterium]MBI2342300.1 transcription antitermination factor NusB [Deltaproteobacteria bacterium]
MGERRKGREFALQILYAYDSSKLELNEVLKSFWITNTEFSEDIKTFTEEIVRGTCSRIEEIDSIIGTHSTNWKVSRMGIVDRNILRFAVYELLWRPDIPVRVTLNEAIEVAKQYGTEDSGSFINGVLDKVAKTVNKE